MTTRRSFFRSLGIATAALYLRIAPDLAARIPDNARGNCELPDGEYEICYITTNATFARAVPMKWDNSQYQHIASMPRHPFKVRNGFIEWE